MKNYLSTPVLEKLLREGKFIKEEGCVKFNYDKDNIMLDAFFDYYGNKSSADLWVGDDELSLTAEQEKIIEETCLKYYKKEGVCIN